jgi:hypothetical protein
VRAVADAPTSGHSQAVAAPTPRRLGTEPDGCQRPPGQISVTKSSANGSPAEVSNPRGHSPMRGIRSLRSVAVAGRTGWLWAASSTLALFAILSVLLLLARA